MEVQVKAVNNGKYNVFYMADDEYIGPCIARGYEWDGWMRKDVEKHYKEDTDYCPICILVFGKVQKQECL